MTVRYGPWRGDVGSGRTTCGGTVHENAVLDNPGEAAPGLPGRAARPDSRTEIGQYERMVSC